MLRLPNDHPAALRCLRLAVPQRRRRFRGPASSRSRRAAPRTRRAGGLPVPVAPAGCRWGDVRVSQVPGRTPRCTCPALRPRWDRSRQAELPLRRADAAFRNYPMPSAPTTVRLSGLHHTACTLAVYASQWGSPLPPRKTRFRLPATLCRAGFAARRVLYIRFLRCSHGGLIANLLTQASPGARGTPFETKF
jgi:hypothetical protein